MSAELFDSVARIARHEVATRPVAAVGRVTTVHSSAGTGPDHAVTVELRDMKVVLPRVPVAVGALGVVVTPAVGDLVVVVFTDGDLHGAVVVGRLHTTELDPPEHAADQIVAKLPPGADDPAVEVTLDAAAPSLTLVVGEVDVQIAERTVTVATGDATLTIDAEGSATATLTVGEAELSLAANGDLTLRTSGALTLEGQSVEITGRSSVAIKGATVDVN